MTISMQIPQFRTYLDNEDYESLAPVFERRYLAEGEFTKRFSAELLEITGAKYGVFAPNGTLALYLALLANNVGSGDEVLVQDSTFIASATSVCMAGATPVFVDILSYRDYSIDISKIKLTKRTKAIVVAHLFGTACTNIEEVAIFCKNNNLLLIEDGAQTLGIKSLQGKHCGTFGDIGTLSFYADKTITTGEGGFVFTNDDIAYDRLIYLRNQGRKNSGTFIHPALGFNFRITDLQAALGLSQLKKLPYISRRKKYIYDRYVEKLNGFVEFNVINHDFSYIPFRVVVFVNDAESVIRKMEASGVQGRSVFYPLHKQPCFENINLHSATFEMANLSYKKGICLPTWIELTDQEIDYVCATLINSL